MRRRTGRVEDGTPAASASQRLRARWQKQLAWSLLVAVAVHAAAFALSPTWRAHPDRVVGPADGGTGAEWELRLLQLAVSASEGRPASAPVAATEPAPPLLHPDEAGRAEAGPRPGEVRERLRAHVARRGELRPTLAEPSAGERPEARVPDRALAELLEDHLDLRGSARAAATRTLPDLGSLELDRLAEVRPELALVSASSWVLIRNQAEVAAFLEERYRKGAVDRGASGSVSVTLWIDRRGAVEWAEVSRSSGHRDLDELALALFNEVADFRAARDRGVTVSRSVTFSLTFPWS